MKRLSKVSFNKQNYVYLKAEMRWNSYSTYDDLVDPTLFNEYEYVDIINSFASQINRGSGNQKILFKFNLSLSDT